MSVPLPSVPETSVASRSSHENESSSVYTAASDYCNLLFPPLLPLPIVVAPVVARAIRGAIKRGEDKGKIKGRKKWKTVSSVDLRRSFPNRCVEAGEREKTEEQRKRGGGKERGMEEISLGKERGEIKMPGEKDEKGKFSARKLSIETNDHRERLAFG